MIHNLAFSGYRSFGESPQYITNLNKLNVLIGRNNSGKSNVLRFLHEVYPALAEGRTFKFSELDRHLPSRPNIKMGVPYCFDMKDGTAILGAPWVEKLKNQGREQISFALAQAFLAKSQQEKTPGMAWAFVDSEGSFITDGWAQAFAEVADHHLSTLWRVLTHHSSGGNPKLWISQIVPYMQPEFLVENCVMIPAIRQIGAKGSSMEGYGGSGIIERLAMLESPSVLQQNEREKFDKINSFVANVTENSSARITVPYQRDTILVHMDNKVLPLEYLGSGLHEVIILAVAATLLDNNLVCMEEPELHLNPVLQKKLIRYLSTATNNQYFISTHSASFIDAPGAAIFHVTQDGVASKLNRVSSHNEKFNVCDDLGYHPSDLLQANCIIWVEGPSDRLYLNWWLASLDPDLIEGVHYSVMFYGGRLLSHLSNNDIDEMVDDFISLRRLNRRGVILIDSDRTSAQSRINQTKSRLRDEFDKGPGFAWITSGREIENYLDTNLVKFAISEVHKTAKPLTSFGKYENTLLVQKPKAGKGQISKMEVAKCVTQKIASTNQYDLKQQLDRLIKFIRKSNPTH